jgi:hypothetical protein
MRLGAGQDLGIVEAKCCVVAVMQRLEALRLLEVKLAAIEQDHEAELAENEDLREQVDAKAEARALTAIFDFLQNCKLAPTDSLLRVFRRYLHAAKTHALISGQQHPPRSRASQKASGLEFSRWTRPAGGDAF